MARKLKPRTPFAERLIAARGQIARKELAARLDAPLTTVAGWERGVSFPPPDMLVRISGMLGVSLDWLIAGRAPQAGAADAALDDALLTRVCEGIAELSQDEGVRIPPPEQARLIARLYGDLVNAYEGGEERRIGLVALLRQVRREIGGG
ncbi:conserved hypothetical protein [uncultured Alphaproteobacteria bacterium]|uniref:HTH cro/C1-type domain-containing protein n=1 Tax=uncultured Alphaproteobacteria bacterium TaxID=91750 RepID=A0A212JDX5_9PROT|nr:conserved hypothetical protein [uncultured Alphaproteobacteria bacterium]